MKYVIQMIGTFVVVFTTLQALINGVIMWSDIFIGVVSSSIVAILLWAFALRRMPEKVVIRKRNELETIQLLERENQNIESVNIIRNLEYARKKIVDLEKEVKNHQEEAEKLTIENHKLKEENKILLEEIEELNPKPEEHMLQW